MCECSHTLEARGSYLTRSHPQIQATSHPRKLSLRYQAEAATHAGFWFEQLSALGRSSSR